MDQQEIILKYIPILVFIMMPDVIQSGLELHFWGSFSDKKLKPWHYAIYILMMSAISAIELRLQPAPLSPLFLLVRTAILWVLGSLLLKCPLAISLLSAIVAKTAALLAAGITASVTFLIAPAAVLTIFGETALGGTVLGLSGQLLTFVLIIVAYQLILRNFKWQGALPNQYLTVFFLPVLMVLLIEQYIFNQVYGNVIIVESAKIIKPVANHWQILFVQLFACFSLFSALYACRRLAEDFSNRTRLLLMEREAAVQRDYLEETQIRYEQTMSFRHDVKHHLQTLYGLLEQGETGKAKEYLGKLETVTEILSFPCKTGNIVVDNVLCSKLSVARLNGIEVECSVRMPSPCIVDDLDLCILFSNAADNAIHACKEIEPETRYLRISGRQKGDFFMIEFENSCRPDGTYKKGIGISNIEAVAEKYQGAVTARKEGGCFWLNVLLVQQCISLRATSTSSLRHSHTCVR